MPRPPASTPRGSPVRLWAPVAAYMAVIFWLSSFSNPPSFPEGSDKGLHLLLYAGLGALIVRALSGGRYASIGVRLVALAAALGAIYGTTDEIHQRFVAGRSFEYWDMVADAAGACCGAAVTGLWGRMRHGL